AADRVQRHHRGQRAVPARSDGDEHAQQLRGPQERPAGDHADPPGAGGAAPRHPGRDLRSDRLPRADHADRAEGRRLLDGPSGHSAARDGQEEEGGPRAGVHRFCRGHARQRLLRGRDQDAVGDGPAVRRLRVQQSHAAGYALVGYWTAYLKANYPAEYMAALLTSVADNKDKSAVYLSECRRLGIKVLPPDVNESVERFSAVGDDIRFGLGAVRNVGANVVQSIIATREEKGKYSSFTDFMDKSDLVVCNKRVLES